MACAALAVRHLVDAGHRSIAYVGGPRGPNQVRDRRTGEPGAPDEAGPGPDAQREPPPVRRARDGGFGGIS